MAAFPFPNLKAYYELVKAFQRSLFTPGLSGSLFSTLQPQPVHLQSFRFAVGASQNPTLSVAVVECVNQVQRKLGPGVNPDFCQLLVTDDPYGKHLSLAPKYVQEIFGTYGVRPPPLIGGAVEGLMGLNPSKLPRSLLGQQHSLRPASGVTLLAAVLPGVRIHPFHTTHDALPELPWDELLQVGRPGPQQENRAAAFILSEPHFTQVPELVARVQSAMPGMPLVGGVLKHGAWGHEFSRQRSMRGALFLGGDSVDEGAVGCIMTGPLQVDSICAPGCRPVGPELAVTKIRSEAHSTLVMELDDQPAYVALAEAQKGGLSARDRLLSLQIGVSAEAPDRGGGYVQLSPRLGPQGSLDVGTADACVGSRVQLHVLDPQWAQEELHSLLQVADLLRMPLQRFAEALPPDAKACPSSLGAFLYSCTGVSHNEPSILEAASGLPLDDLPFQGAKVQGEIGQMLLPGGRDAPIAQGNSLLQSYCSNFGFMRKRSSMTREAHAAADIAS